MNRIRHFVDQLFNDGYTVTELQHGFRINGFIDIYKGGKTVYNKHTNIYHRFSNEEESIEFTKQSIVGTEKVPDFKKAKNGMTWQEFKHQMSIISDSSHAEDYHWRVNDNITDSDLYIVFHRDTAKIGKSKNVNQRLKQLKTGLSHSPEMFVFKGKGHLEKVLHQIFSEFKTSREWFVADYRIFRFAKKYGVPV